MYCLIGCCYSFAIAVFSLHSRLVRPEEAKRRMLQKMLSAVTCFRPITIQLMRQRLFVGVNWDALKEKATG
jgi:hypothetical protein